MANLTKANVIVVTEHHKGADCDLDEEEQLKVVKNDKGLALEGFWSASKQRQKGKGGGIVIYWRKELEAEVWEGPDLPNNLKHAGLERIWIKAKCKDKQQAIGGVYMSNKNNSIRDIRKNLKFKRIMQVWT